MQPGTYAYSFRSNPFKIYGNSDFRGHGLLLALCSIIWRPYRVALQSIHPSKSYKPVFYINYRQHSRTKVSERRRHSICERNNRIEKFAMRPCCLPNGSVFTSIGCTLNSLPQIAWRLSASTKISPEMGPLKIVQVLTSTTAHHDDKIQNTISARWGTPASSVRNIERHD